MISPSSENGFPLTPEFLESVGTLPGVYLMKDGTGEVIYVGKARDLRKRLASYARHDRHQATKTAVLLNKIRRIDTIITETEKEALILEASLIKKYHPRYNVILRDDKNYPFIKVTVAEKWPRVMMARRKTDDGARYFGPFSSSAAMWETLNYLNSIFPLRRCKGAEVQPRQRPCLNHQMRRCLAPCVGKADSDRYGEMVNSILMVLEGKKEKLVEQLTVRMQRASAALHFEEAALCRDWIRAVRETLEKQLVVDAHGRDQDLFGFAREGGAVALSVLLVRGGRLEDHLPFFLADPLEEDAEILRQAVEGFYGDGRPVPREVVLPFHPADLELLHDWLVDLKGVSVAMVVPQRGDRLGLLRMAETNARQIFSDKQKKSQSWLALAEILQKGLSLRRSPRRIECLDISNIGGEQAVGSLVCFVDGEREKKGYRHYKIRTVSGADDYAMMAEVLRRRLSKGQAEGTLPDLLLVDGGKGQLNVARVVAEELGLAGAIDLAGIAKERDEEGEKLYLPGRKNPILLPRHSPSLLFLMRVRDEAHRYGITFHRRWRGREALSSALDRIPGLGPVRRQALLAALGSVKRISQASVDDLIGVAGIGPQLGRQIWSFFHE
ncbi:MAG: excinuclease ABC subunit UvrC [Desulfobulbaceae bacterium]|nr:excinuclease ABC subunit UvrC [Desulfobulbaceae bacterium]